MISRISFLSVLLTVAVSGSAEAQAYRFLNAPFSPRAAALGGAPVALADASPALIHANPAYLSAEHHRQFGLAMASQVGGLTFSSATGAWSVGTLGTIGFGVRRVGYGDLEERDAAGEAMGSFHASDLAVKTAFSAQVGPRLRYGLSIDLIHSAYTFTRSTAWAVSVGLLATLPDESVVGVSLLNAGAPIEAFDGDDASLPLDVRVGYSRKLQYLPLRLVFTANGLQDPDTRHPLRHLEAGGEFLFSPNVVFRLGYNHRLHEQLRFEDRIDFSGYAVGLGLRIKGIRMDVSRTSYSTLGSLLQIGTDLHF